MYKQEGGDNKRTNLTELKNKRNNDLGNPCNIA